MLPESCAWCGEDFLDGVGMYCLDLFTSEDDEQWAQFYPCCEALQEAVAQDGWDEVFGCSLEETVAHVFALEVVEVLDGDGLVRCRLRVKDLTIVVPEARHGGPLKGCESPSGWQVRIFDAVEKHHRHHDRPKAAWKFGVELWNGLVRVGVAVVEKPKSRLLEQSDGTVLEVTRLATFGRKALRANAASKLYAYCADQARALGATRLITYTLESENGASLKASGFVRTAYVKPERGGWNRRGRGAETPIELRGAKIRWERGLTKQTRKLVADATARYE